MKILVPGKLPTAKVYRAICQKCKCQFEFVRSEARLFHDQRDGDYLIIACPTCSEGVTASV